MSGLSLGRLVSNLKAVALTVFELLAFNSHERPLRTNKQTNTHTSNERIISAIHFVHLAEIIIYADVNMYFILTVSVSKIVLIGYSCKTMYNHWSQQDMIKVILGPVLTPYNCQLGLH